MAAGKFIRSRVSTAQVRLRRSPHSHTVGVWGQASCLTYPSPSLTHRQFTGGSSFFFVAAMPLVILWQECHDTALFSSYAWSSSCKRCAASSMAPCDPLEPCPLQDTPGESDDRACASGVGQNDPAGDLVSDRARHFSDSQHHHSCTSARSLSWACLQ
jgi:hypothetical protein